MAPRGLQHYWKAELVGDLGGGDPEYPINGACHDVAPDATAFGHRDATCAVVIAGMWPEPADNEANTQWVREYDAAIAPLSQGGGWSSGTAGCWTRWTAR